MPFLMTELFKILPLELEDYFSSINYEGEGFLQVNEIKFFNNEMYFNFSIYIGNYEKNEIQYWQLKVINYRDSKIDIENLGGYFEFYSNHFLLWEFIDDEVELYFKNATDSPEILLANIYKIHKHIFNNYISLEKYINGNDLILNCKSRNGLFARGPKNILKLYYNCLEKDNMNPYYLESNKNNFKSKNLKVALLGGTYFIGEDFIFTRINN